MCLLTPFYIGRLGCCGVTAIRDSSRQWLAPLFERFCQDGQARLRDDLDRLQNRRLPFPMDNKRCHSLREAASASGARRSSSFTRFHIW